MPTSILHYIILKKLPKQKEIFYTRDIGEVINKVNSKNYDIGFIVPNITAGDVQEIAYNLEKMPQKTTYFYPKLPVGITISKF